MTELATTMLSRGFDDGGDGVQSPTGSLVVDGSIMVHLDFLSLMNETNRVIVFDSMIATTLNSYDLRFPTWNKMMSHHAVGH